MKVLIADDDSSFRGALEEQLSNWGYEVIAVSDGLGAWDVITGDNPPKLILLDWMMPGIGGIETGRRIRTRDEDTYCYIILLAAKGGGKTSSRGSMPVPTTTW